MKKLNINLGERSYPIVIGTNLLAKDLVLDWICSRQVFIVSSSIVSKFYLSTVKQALSSKEVHEIILPDGEKHKNLDTISKILDAMIAAKLDRTATVIALGGGVVGDMTGFAAACYQRGVPFIQIPTTLLSQVDSSVGGKTGVNHPQGKNMIGAFYQPVGVLIDIQTLQTLDKRQFSAGIAEIIKYGIINDLNFFEWLEENIRSVMCSNVSTLEYIIEQSCWNKARIVEQDEKEKGLRALLNLGHTFGHAIETATNYETWLHGETVALGIVMAAHMSCLHGWLDKQQVKRITDLLRAANLPAEPSKDFSSVRLSELIKRDKKVRHGRFRLILSKGIGQSFVCDDYEEEKLKKTLDFFALG